MQDRPNLPTASNDGQTKIKIFVGISIVLVLIVGLVLVFSSTKEEALSSKNKVATATKSEANSSLEEKQTTSLKQYDTYVNPRFGFKLEYPSAFIKEDAPKNNDGITLHSSDKQAVITASAGFASSSVSVQGQYEQEMERINGTIGYHVAGDSWYVITWEHTGKLYYRKVMFKHNLLNQFEIAYPTSQKDMYSPVVEHIESTFIPGDKG